MWLYLAALVGLYYLLRWYRERQVVSHLWDKYVFITGCDSGFGNLLARQLDLRGLRVLAACLTEKGAQKLKGQTSDRVETVILDVTNTQSIAAATQWVKERVGDRGLWGLVNNAGTFHPFGYTDWLKIDTYMSTLQVNLIGLIETGVGGLLRHELQHFGVKVSIVEPGCFRTEMTDLQKASETMKQVWKEVPPHIKETYGQKFFDAYFENMKNGLLQSSTNLNLVTDCMEHALTSVHPRTRYSAGWDAQFFFIPLSYLPTSLADYILTRSWPKPAQAV
ncbi:17-beta-hydroxysteroid dehydrogenase type 6 [Camelus dromedarius]|uniref:17-beta-hydroxysteroid dehydrogenase type 6 n=1 Tax=Camelus dromedarius TaxID=9838 RepID=A0A5N4DHM4_CAMDR|nr:17-beta-hydroxysteroid dehydrogenase type 6 [Camelus dromedarius]